MTDEITDPTPMTYDFRSPQQLNKEQLSRLESLHEIFAQLLSSSLSGTLRMVVDIDVAVLVARHDHDPHPGHRRAGRLVLLTTRGEDRLPGFRFRNGDTILLGRESAGVPGLVHDAADARVVISMTKGARSLNVALAAAMALGEALRQTNQFPYELVPETAET